MKKIVLPFVCLFFSIIAFAQNTAASSSASFDIRKKIEPPLLEIMEGPMFVDADGNKAINANENCKIIFTDSGGIQEEAYFFKIPCVTIRNNTERPHTITNGKNILSGYKNKKIIQSFYCALKKKQLNNKVYGTGNASKIIYKFTKSI